MMKYKRIKRYLLGLLLVMGGVLTASAQSSGDGYKPDNPSEPGEASTLVEYAVTAVPNIAGAGTVTGSGRAKYQATVSLRATASSGYKFLHWLKDDATEPCSTQSPYNYTMEKADVKFTAVFEKAKKITVNLSDSKAGTVSGSGSSFYKGGKQTISTSPNTNYEFRYWLKNDDTEPYSTERSFVYTVEDEDVSFTAVYEYVEPPYLPENPSEPNVEAGQMVSYTLNVLLNDAAAGVVTGNGKYKWGTSVAISTSPNAGYEFRKWLKGTEEYSTATSFNYTVTSEDVTFTAVYEYVGVPEPEPTSHKVYFESSPVGACTFSMASGTDVDIESSFSVTATPGTDFVFLGWYNGTQKVAETLNVSTYMGNEDITLTAKLQYAPDSPDEPTGGGYEEKPEGVLGDVDGDGEVNVTDAIELINVILANRVGTLNIKVCDMNDDDEINITDAIEIINLTLKAKK